MTNRSNARRSLERNEFVEASRESIPNSSSASAAARGTSSILSRRAEASASGILRSGSIATSCVRSTATSSLLYDGYTSDVKGDAFWTVDNDGTEVAMCCLNAQLRDYTRFGLLYLNDGERDGEQVVPAEWIEESTTPQSPHEEPGGSNESFGAFEYGYKWWIPDGSDHEFLATGVWGGTSTSTPTRRS